MYESIVWVKEKRNLIEIKSCLIPMPPKNVLCCIIIYLLLLTATITIHTHRLC